MVNTIRIEFGGEIRIGGAIALVPATTPPLITARVTTTLPIRSLGAPTQLDTSKNR